MRNRGKQRDALSVVDQFSLSKARRRPCRISGRFVVNTEAQLIARHPAIAIPSLCSDGIALPVARQVPERGKVRSCTTKVNAAAQVA